MRSKTSEWYEIGIRYSKVQEDGSSKPVTELYAVDALSFSEAEQRIIEEMKVYISGDYKVKTMKKAPYKEIFFTDAEGEDKWYKAKLQFITLDEKSQMEKRSNVVYLLQGSSLNSVCKSIDEIMGGTMINYESMSVQQTKLMDVFEHKK